MDLLELEDSYCEHLGKSISDLKSHYEEVVKALRTGYRENDITKAILTRMRAFYKAEDEEKRFLDYNIKQPAAYFFEKTVLFYTKAYVETMQEGYHVVSQESIRLKNGNSLRPDIIVKDKDKNIISVIECKTQFGWDRNSWETNFKEREKNLKEVKPGAKMFLLVLTGVNWDSNKFQELERYGKDYFCLTSCWPKDLSDPINDNQILTPIENLFKKLI
jgi:hypothetical protein